MQAIPSSNPTAQSMPNSENKSIALPYNQWMPRKSVKASINDWIQSLQQYTLDASVFVESIIFPDVMRMTMREWYSAYAPYLFCHFNAEGTPLPKQAIMMIRLGSIILGFGIACLSYRYDPTMIIILSLPVVRFAILAAVLPVIYRIWTRYHAPSFPQSIQKQREDDELKTRFTKKFRQLASFPIKIIENGAFSIPPAQRYINAGPMMHTQFPLLHELGHLVHADQVSMIVFNMIPLWMPYIVALYLPVAAWSMGFKWATVCGSVMLRACLVRAIERRADRFAMTHCETRVEKVDAVLSLIDLYRLMEHNQGYRIDFDIINNHCDANIYGIYPLFTQRIVNLCHHSGHSFDQMLNGSISEHGEQLSGYLLEDYGTETEPLLKSNQYSENNVDSLEEDSHEVRTKRQERLKMLLRRLRKTHLNLNPQRNKTMTVAEILNIRRNQTPFQILFNWAQQQSDALIDCVISLNTKCLLYMRLDDVVEAADTRLSNAGFVLFDAIRKQYRNLRTYFYPRQKIHNPIHVAPPMQTSAEIDQYNAYAKGQKVGQNYTRIVASGPSRQVYALDCGMDLIFNQDHFEVVALVEGERAKNAGFKLGDRFNVINDVRIDPTQVTEDDGKYFQADGRQKLAVELLKETIPKRPEHVSHNFTEFSWHSDSKYESKTILQYTVDAVHLSYQNAVTPY